MMKALEPFEVTVAFCFTPESLGSKEHHTSPPRDAAEFAACRTMTRRYAT